jgi:phage anti-repressor protein
VAKKESDNTKSKKKKMMQMKKKQIAKIEPVKIDFEGLQQRIAYLSCKTYQLQLEAAKEVHLYSEQEPNKKASSSIYTRKKKKKLVEGISSLRSLQKVRNIYMRP